MGNRPAVIVSSEKISTSRVVCQSNYTVSNKLHEDYTAIILCAAQLAEENLCGLLLRRQRGKNMNRLQIRGSDAKLKYYNDRSLSFPPAFLCIGI